tara:strand:- start:221 stop:721 length:501 start_codon:yes stop_codon:yes gene_type:complete
VVLLRKPKAEDIIEIKYLYESSITFHQPWTCAPINYENYIQQDGRYFACASDTGKIVGAFHISGILRGYFQSAFLGYEVFHPYQGKGYMSKGLKLIITEAFDNLNLHRLEANIQPDNFASIKLVANNGFIKEGFSRNYLKVSGGEWKDHERWAIVNANWSEKVDNI